MICTATAAVSAISTLLLVRSHEARMASDSAFKIGTKTPKTRSAGRWTRALPFWSSPSGRALWAGGVVHVGLVAALSASRGPLTVEPRLPIV